MTEDQRIIQQSCGWIAASPFAVVSIKELCRQNGNDFHIVELGQSCK